MVLVLGGLSNRPWISIASFLHGAVDLTVFSQELAAFREVFNLETTCFNMHGPGIRG